MVARRSAGGSRLVVNYQAPSLTAKVGRLVARGMARVARQPRRVDRRAGPLGVDPDRMAALLRVHGFSVVDDSDMVEITQARSLPVTPRRSTADGRVAVADR